MAEEEAKQEEEKFEFTPEGEALGYISLDQARVLAVQHARDNRDFYGPGYANRELVWDELSAEEGEDYYRIRLSYRPVRGFRGKLPKYVATHNQIGEQDRVIAEQQRPEELPLDLAEEFHLKGPDAMALAYRRALGELGVEA